MTADLTLNPSSSPSPAALEGAVLLPHLGVLQVQGPDAARFLHGQLTQDFVLLDETQARLAAHLTPKGRMQASFIGLRVGADRFLLLVHRDLLAASARRLGMYKLRAQLEITDASAHWQLWGLAGAAARALLPADAAPWRRADHGSAHAVALYPAAGTPRALWIAPADAGAPDAPALDAALWHWSEVHSGVVTLSAPLVDAFVPQMLNYESIGGVNFKKGCYPGQEVVARSQFRGAIKRRTALFHAAQALAVGAEVFAQEDAEQPVGTVAQAAPAPGGGCDALVVVNTAAAGAPLHAGGTPQPLALTPLPLPYALREDL